MGQQTILINLIVTPFLLRKALTNQKYPDNKKLIKLVIVSLLILAAHIYYFFANR
jgi:hypothetical protein